MDLVTLGEILIDLTQTGVHAERVRQFAAFPGGAPANVAVAAARLGLSVGFIGKVGADSFGRDLRRVLTDNNVSTEGLFETEQAPTTMAVVSVSPEGERSFSFYRSPGADTLLTKEEAAAALAGYGPSARILHVGSLSLTDDPARSATMEALRRAKAAGMLVSYDPNYRAALWKSEKEAVRRMTEPMRYADILKVSEEELFLLTGSSDPRMGSLELGSMGPKLVLITLGAKGAFYRFGIHTGAVPGVSVTVADTNGAGDSFLGAALSRLIRRGDEPLKDLTPAALEEIVAYANAAAAVTCTRPGAIPALPTEEEVQKVFPG